ncbi:M1 family metallopeptidase [Arenibacter sp. BSSL-BM3]|uniref:Aminopeptidase N n=1 Tax=Arenibacter arenosicollis TaxID=2762274 RepID=A0ABR7QMP1_9FLAO|nr:M1 family metallopeptidase [Arenibacter arenosicollis]MBC8768458.1 M1 family metallopeptidase [Arenibacter arenosicollis]
MKYILLLLLIYFYIPINAQHQDKVDFIRGNVDISIDPKQETITGTVTYQLTALQKVDSVFLDAQNIQLIETRLNNKKVKITNSGKNIIVHKTFKANKSYTLKIKYVAIPKQTVYFLGWSDDILGNEQVWTQGQGKYTSHWLPSFDDMTEKVEFDLDITFDKNYVVIANGDLLGTKDLDGLKKWRFNMEKPMSSYLLAFSIGDYHKKQILSNRGVPIDLYHYPSDSSLVEPTYRFTKDIFDFLEKEIGVDYPWQNYKEIPVRDFLYAGMENTGTTIFSDTYVMDSIAFKDRNYVNVNAHEMAHQWFGDLVTEVDGSSHWLHEGFATYYALLAERELFGKEYYYWKLYESAIQLQELTNKDGGETLIDPKASSLTFYEKGAWALHMLREQLGEENFRKGIQQYLKTFEFRNATVDDFIKEMELVSDTDLGVFRNRWLEDKEFPFSEAKTSLVRESEDLRNFFSLQREVMTSSTDNESIIKRYWGSTKSDQLKSQIIKIYFKSMSENFLSEVLGSNNVMVRQAIAISVGQIPLGLKSEFESLLEDESYVTKEAMLYKLWINYPSDRANYLDKTKNVIGFSNRNIRLLWLTLALLTKDYEPNNTNDYYVELSGYTSPMYTYEVRQVAFQFLEELIGFSDENLLDLINGTQHHTWQFRKYSRTLLDQLLEKKEYRERIDRLKVKLNEVELRYISNKLISE